MEFENSIDNKKLELRRRLREILVEFPQIIEKDPPNWWRASAKLIIRTEKNLQNEPPEIKEYLSEYLPYMHDALRRESENIFEYSETNPTEGCAVQLEKEISNLSMVMAKKFDKEGETVTENVVTLNEMTQTHPDIFEVLDEVNKKGINFIPFKVTPFKGSDSYVFLIPKGLPIGYKGGVARGINDCYQDSPFSMKKKEYPPSDFDAAAIEGDYNPRVVAEIMGVDPDGLEIFKGEKIDFNEYALGRDTTQNQVYLDSKGLHFSDEAKLATKTGKIKIVGGYKPNKAIYGIDLVVTDGVTLSKPRGLMRLVKPVAEGKALEFDYLPLNSIMDFGIYSLFLARKWSKKDDFGTLLQQMFYLEKQMGQVRHNERNAIRLLRRVHSENPYYDMTKSAMKILDLVRYKSEKLIKQIDREFGWEYQIPSGLKVTRFPNDTVPQRISLDGFTPSDFLTSEIVKWWPQFMEECNRRTHTFHSKPIDPVTKYFLKQDMEDAEIDRDFME